MVLGGLQEGHLWAENLCLQDQYQLCQLRQKGFSEKELANFAKTNSDIVGNGAWKESWYNEKIDNVSQRPYDDFNIRVLHCEMRSTDTFYDVKHTNKYGNFKFYEDEYGKERDTKTKKTRKTHVNNIYTVKWIIGTEYSGSGNS